MLIFDSHCDSATCALSREASLNQRVRGRQFDFASAVGVTDFQVMAIYLDKEPRSAITYADLATPLAKLQAEINANGEVRLVSRAQELSQWQQGPLGVILAVEGGEIIEKAEQLDALYGLGIRSLTLTWNSDNRLAGGNGGSPTLGLTALGRDVLRKYGYEEYAIHRIGHGQGLGRHEEPFLIFNSTLVLQEGMVFTVEPGIYIPGLGGFRHSDTLIITKDGCENTTDFRREFSEMVF